MGSGDTPIQMLEFNQICSVRTLKQGEHERMRVKPNDASKVLHISYVDEGSHDTLLATHHDTVSHYKVYVHVIHDSSNICTCTCIINFIYEESYMYMYMYMYMYYMCYVYMYMYDDVFLGLKIL